MWSMIVRHRFAFHGLLLVTAIALQALAQAPELAVAIVGFGLIILLLLALAVVGIVQLNARRPPHFVIRHGTFVTPDNAGQIVASGGSTVLAVMYLGWTVQNVRHDRRIDAVQVILMVLWLLILVLNWFVAPRRVGLILRPDGVLDQQLLGSAFAPWEAGLTAWPSKHGVVVRAQNPALVVRRGWRRPKEITSGADQGFSAWAINVYAQLPAQRPGIGTPDGLSWLTGAP